MDSGQSHQQNTTTLQAANLPQELLPTSSKRIMKNASYMAAFFGGCVSIGTFSSGAALMGVLNFAQAATAMLIGCVVIGIALTLCGKAGNKYGIPYTIQARSAFGVGGSKVPGILRGIPAIVWFGFQSWVGAGAINLSLHTLFGIQNMPVVFVLFTALQVVLSASGFKGIKALENICSVFILLTLAYMFYIVFTQYNAEVVEQIISIKGSWGLPFWGGTTVFLGIYSTIILNASDYSREYKQNASGIATSIIYVGAILPITLFMGLIGLMVTGATGNADPVTVFSTTLNNKFLSIVTLLFVAFAQVSTNVLNNIVPPSYVLMDLFKLTYKKSVVIVGALSLASFPWLLVRPESAGGLALFIKIYSAFLGPIFAVLFVDYFIIRKQSLNLEHLYDGKGPYRGVNFAGILAICIGSVISLFFVQISWYVSLLPSGLVYYLLMRGVKNRFLS